MVDVSTLHCSYCKNKCSILDPGCSNCMSVEEATRLAAQDEEVCRICEKRCSYLDLGCDLGKTMAKIKDRI